ncbi:MAG: PHP domain-containing protein [Candidatus Thorarchaeota archaeon]
MVRARADLHTHSSGSDGSDSPSVIARKADMIGLGGVALTDHDSLDGLQEFMNAGVSDELIVVPGLEISAEYRNKEIHILGYFVPLDSKPLNEKLQFLRDARHKRLPKMIQKLQELEVDVTIEELYENLDGVASPGRPHVAQLLVEKGVVKTTREAFQKYLAADKPAYVKKERMEAGEAVRLLSSVGAAPVLAHPLTIKVPNLRVVIDYLMKEGLVGIEVEYDYGHIVMNIPPIDVRKTVEDLDLVLTGGSDYHGTVHFTELGSISVPVEVIDELQAKVKK